MNKRTDNKNLLAEVLAESSVPADFRATMLAETLRCVHRRRQLRRTRQIGGVLMMLSLLAVFVAQQFSQTPPALLAVAKKIMEPSYKLVRTLPLPAIELVATRSFSTVKLIGSTPTVFEIATVGGGFRVINDNELLALLADKSVILIRTGPNSEELVFASQEEQKKLFLFP